MTDEQIDALAEAIIKRLDLPTKAEILEAIVDALPCSSQVTEAIAKAIGDSMPWPSEIQNAIFNGVYKAHGGS